MPAKFDLTWDAKNARWRVQHNGLRYVRSCRQLGVPSTKEASYQAANAWWKAKLSEIEGLKEPHRHAAILDELDRRQDRAKAHGRQDEASEWSAKKRALENLKEADEVEVIPESFLLSEEAKQRREVWALLSNHLDDPIVADALLNDEPEDLVVIPQDKTIGGLVRRYLKGFDLRRKAGDLSPSEYALQERCLTMFSDWIGPKNPAETITSHKWEEYWQQLLHRTTTDANFGNIYAEKCFKYARRFVRWLAAMGLNPEPGNLGSHAYRFDTTPGPIQTFTVIEVKRIIEKAPVNSNSISCSCSTAGSPRAI